MLRNMNINNECLKRLCDKAFDFLEHVKCNIIMQFQQV